MRSRNINAIVISRKNIGEADRLLTLYSLEEGKIQIVARGSRKIQSKLSCHIEPFTIGTFYIVKGKTLDILAGAECMKQPIRVTKDLELYKDISYVLEVLNLSTKEGQPSRDIFDLTCQIIDALESENDKNLRSIYILFYVFRILNISGYMPNYSICKSCGDHIIEQNYYSVDYEGAICNHCANGQNPVDKNVVKVLRLFMTLEIKDIPRISVTPGVSMQIKKIINEYLYGILPVKPSSDLL